MSNSTNVDEQEVSIVKPLMVLSGAVVASWVVFIIILWMMWTLGSWGLTWLGQFL